MNIIRLRANENGGYPPMQSWDSQWEIPEGHAAVPDELDTAVFYDHNGFVTLTVEEGVVTAMEPNTAAWEAWKAKYPPADPNQALAAEVRAKRDALLTETDWTQVLDAPIDAATREAYRTYRQALRDLPEQAGFPQEVVWPELPATAKAAPDPVDAAFDALIGGEGNA